MIVGYSYSGLGQGQRNQFTHFSLRKKGIWGRKIRETRPEWGLNPGPTERKLESIVSKYDLQEPSLILSAVDWFARLSRFYIGQGRPARRDSSVMGSDTRLYRFTAANSSSPVCGSATSGLLLYLLLQCRTVAVALLLPID